MSANKLNVAFLWHMHQPFYLDPQTDTFKMPWVRLHCVKDYLDMLLIAEKYEKVKVGFNFTPSLLQQIQMYLDGKKEFHLELTLKSPSDLTTYEKVIILKDFFMANWENMIKPFPRYYELLIKRGNPQSNEEFSVVQRFFNKQDLLDLQLLFNLAWVDPLFRKTDPLLQELVKKGRNFTEEDKKLLIEKHFEIIKKVISAYSKAYNENKIEISLSPFYHPILPLLIDTNVATKSEPSTNLPNRRFQYPLDAYEQINSAINFGQDIFGKRSSGMWPSEGSVSNEALELIARAGLKWAATDEQILAKTLNSHHLPGDSLYRAYIYDTTHGALNLFFRDRKLSDNIGFVYSRMTAEDASSHFVNTLHDIRRHLDEQHSRSDYIVPIILDGENAWEYYPEDGYNFLTKLYEKLESDPLIEVVTFSEYLNRHKDLPHLQNIHPGSWINANFKIWIGHDEDNTAWDFLSEAREIFEKNKENLPESDKAAILKSLYIAEGSDWCWWYGDEHSTEFSFEFDELFRNYIKDIYKKMKIEYPPQLDTPIVKKEKDILPEKELMNFITPKIDGKVSSYFEWLGAASFDLRKFGFAMHRTHVYFEMLYLGFDLENVYFRFDPEPDFTSQVNYFPLVFTMNCNNDYYIEGAIDINSVQSFYLKTPQGLFPIEAAFYKTLELKIPLNLLNLKEGDVLSFFTFIQLKNSESIRFPIRGTVKYTIPNRNFEEYLWHA